MLHQPDARQVGKEVTEHAFHERRPTRENLPHDHNSQFKADISPERPEIPGACKKSDDRINDELPHPQRREGDKCTDDPEDEEQRGVPAVGPPDKAEEGGEILEGLYSFTPRRGFVGSGFRHESYS
jgi:hypothetical protein